MWKFWRSLWCLWICSLWITKGYKVKFSLYMPFIHVGEWEWRVTNSEPQRWVEDIRQLCAQDPLHPREICWYQLNRRWSGGLRNRSGYCKNDKILHINGVLLSEVAVDISVLKLTSPKNWRTSLLQCCGFHSVDDNGSDLLEPYTVWRIWHIPTFQMNVVPSTSVVMTGVREAWKLKTPLLSKDLNLSSSLHSVTWQKNRILLLYLALYVKETIRFRC